MSRPGTDLARPWTVIALSAWSVLSLLWGLFFIDGWQIGDLLSIGLSIAFVRGYWMGQRWAFHLTFASAILCGIFLIGHVIFASEASSALAKVFSVLIIVGMIYLVLHPATKRFVRLDEELESARPTGPPDRGGRVAQAVAISIFGILAVALPVLWAFGNVDSRLLLLGLAACIASGVAVLILGLPAQAASRSPER